eukprot:1515922-Karenia_brevis.AAC.1
MATKSVARAAPGMATNGLNSKAGDSAQGMATKEMDEANSGVALMGMAAKADEDSAGMATKERPGSRANEAPKGMATKACDSTVLGDAEDLVLLSGAAELEEPTDKGMATKELGKMPAGSICADCFGSLGTNLMRHACYLSAFASPFLKVLRTTTGSFGRFTGLVCDSFFNPHKLQLYENRAGTGLFPLPFKVFAEMEKIIQMEVMLTKDVTECVLAWCQLAICTLTWNYYGRSAWPSFSDAVELKPGQRSAIKALVVRVAEFVKDNDSVFEDKDYNQEVHLKKVSYSGEEQYHAEMLSWSQVEPALPPLGLAGSVPAESLCDGYVRECLLDPSLLLKTEDEVPALPRTPAVWVADDEWEQMALNLVSHKVFGVLEE